MSRIKNNAKITKHLQRIFIYSEEMDNATTLSHESRVDSFVQYLRTTVDPETDKPYEISSRSMYDYIAGTSQFPVDLLNPLVNWSADAELMAAYGIMLPMTENEKFMKKLEEKEASLKKINDEIALMKSRIR